MSAISEDPKTEDEEKSLYDASEARRLLADASEAHEPATKRAEKAARQLLAAAEALNHDTQVILERVPDNPDVLKMSLGNRSVWVKHTGFGKFGVYEDTPAPYRVPRQIEKLIYNPASKMIEGTEEADADVPFQPKIRRSALAVLVAETLVELQAKILKR